MEKRRLKVCFAASSGGHYEQLLMLKPLMEKYDSFIITEKTSYAIDVEGVKTYYMIQTNRKEKTLFFKMTSNIMASFSIYFA